MSILRSTRVAALIACAVAGTLAAQNPAGRAGGGGGGGRARPIQIMTLSPSDWKDGGVLPDRHAQRGRDISPALTWSAAPAGTTSFALIMHDIDAPTSTGADDLLHWMVWNIPATATGLPEGVGKGPQLADGSYQVSATGQMYRGPGAPATGPQHHYMFEVFALDMKLDVQPSADAFDTRANVMKAMQGHILGKAVYGGLFRRPQ